LGIIVILLEGFEDLFINRNFRNTLTKDLETILTSTQIYRTVHRRIMVKFGMDFYAIRKKLPPAVVLSGILILRAARELIQLF